MEDTDDTEERYHTVDSYSDAATGEMPKLPWHKRDDDTDGSDELP